MIIRLLAIDGNATAKSGGAEFMKVGEKNGEERLDIGRFLIPMSVDYTHRWLPKVV